MNVKPLNLRTPSEDTEREVEAMLAELEGRLPASETWTEPFAASDKAPKPG